MSHLQSGLDQLTFGQLVIGCIALLGFTLNEINRRRDKKANHEALAAQTERIKMEIELARLKIELQNNTHAASVSQGFEQVSTEASNVNSRLAALQQRVLGKKSKSIQDKETVAAAAAEAHEKQGAQNLWTEQQFQGIMARIQYLENTSEVLTRFRGKV